MELYHEFYGNKKEEDEEVVSVMPTTMDEAGELSSLIDFLNGLNQADDSMIGV